MTEQIENKIIKNDDTNMNTVNIFSIEKITTNKNSQQINIQKNRKENPQKNSYQENSRLKNSTIGNTLPEQTTNNNESFFLKIKTKIIIGILLGIIIAGIVILCVILLKNDEKNKIPQDSDEEISTPINPIQKEEKHIESEFAFKTEVKDLIGLNVKQKSTEKIITNRI
jgi:hypothetical protein